MMANKNATFTQLTDIVYIVMGIDKTRYDINIHFLMEPLCSLPATKLPIKDDYDVEFVMYEENKYKVIYVDMIRKDAGVCNIHNEPQNQFPSYNGANQDAGVDIPLTLARSPLWNDDFSTYGTTGLSDDASHTDDNGDNETYDNGDDSGGGGEGGGSPKYPEVKFLGSQFEDNPLHGN